MLQAIALTEWFLNEAHRIYAMFNGQGELPVNREESIILTKIRECGGEATTRQLKDRIFKYHQKGGAEALAVELLRIVEVGILSVRCETASNGRNVETFCIAVPSSSVSPETSENQE